MRRLLRFAYLALSLGVVPGDAAWRFNPLEDLETEGKKSGELERDDIEKTWKWTILERLMGPFDIPKVYVLDLYIPLFETPSLSESTQVQWALWRGADESFPKSSCRVPTAT